jgi:L-seryl-tRNA(Ser) seleniumtransferase
MKVELLRQLPSVENLLQTVDATRLVAVYGRPATLEAIRGALARAREAIGAGKQSGATIAELLAAAEAQLSAVTAPTLRPVINATGVIIHTNLGRSVLSAAAERAIAQAARSYDTLEYDLETGKRGSRSTHVQELLARVTGAEAATVVNNNAAAVLLTLTAMAHGREVIISRGQLVEIGGGFRIPAVMEQSGAELVEVGTTNRTHLRDYEAAITERTAAIMVAHHSNFRIIGFTTEPELVELSAMAHERGLLLLHDLGSGTLLETADYGLEHEPTVGESLAAGVDVTCFSGDKLLGGPQAGIIIGRKELVKRIQRHPLARAVRPDKLCLAGLSATLLHYLKDEAIHEIPTWRMIATSPDDLKRIARRWARRLTRSGIPARSMRSESTIGGGSLPGATLPTWLVVIPHASPNALAAQLRAAETPIIGRIENDQFLLDPRTVLPEQEELLLQSVLQHAAVDAAG